MDQSGPSQKQRVQRTLERIHERLAGLAEGLAAAPNQIPNIAWQTEFAGLLEDLNALLGQLYQSRLTRRLTEAEREVLLPCLEDVRSLLRRPNRSRASNADRAVRRAQARLQAALNAHRSRRGSR